MGIATTDDWAKLTEGMLLNIPYPFHATSTTIVEGVRLRIASVEKARDAGKKVFAEHAALFDKLAK